MQEKTLKHTSLCVRERKNVTIDGVENVLGFDESYVSLMTVAGRIVVEGQGLKIESLSKENGEISIIGKIDGVLYAEEKGAKGILARIFK